MNEKSSATSLQYAPTYEQTNPKMANPLPSAYNIPHHHHQPNTLLSTSFHPRNHQKQVRCHHSAPITQTDPSPHTTMAFHALQIQTQRKHLNQRAHPAHHTTHRKPLTQSIAYCRLYLSRPHPDRAPSHFPPRRHRFEPPSDEQALKHHPTAAYAPK